MQFPSMEAWFEKSPPMQRVFMRAASALLWIAFAVELIERVQSSRIASIVTGIGMLTWLTALVIAPICWSIVEAKPGSNSRKTIYAMFFFGILLQIAGLVARYPFFPVAMA